LKFDKNVLNIIHIDNSNLLNNTIGGIVSYIKDATTDKNISDLSYYIVGSGNPKFENFIQVTSRSYPNIFFFLKLFITQFKLPNTGNIIYHLHEPYMLLPLYFKTRAKFVLTFHGIKSQSIRDRKHKILYILYEIVTKSLLKRFDGYISDSDAIFLHHKNKYHFAPKKNITLPVSVDLKKFRPREKDEIRELKEIPKQKKIILYIGRISYEKNIELIIDALHITNIIREKEYQLLIGGEGPKLDELKQKSVILKLAKYIKFLGILSKDEVADYMNIADVFVISSLREGGPITLKESLACNLKVVSVPVGDAPEIIPDFEGCKSTSYEPTEFAQSIIDVIEDNKHFDYSEKVKLFSQKIFQQKMNNFYRSL